MKPAPCHRPHGLTSRQQLGWPTTAGTGGAQFGATRQVGKGAGRAGSSFMMEDAGAQPGCGVGSADAKALRAAELTKGGGWLGLGLGA